MAARENQGLQIALMIFFLLVVLLSVTTYIFFKISSDKDVALAKANEKISTKESQLININDQIIAYRKLVGFEDPNTPILGTPDAPEPDSILALYREDMDKFAGNIEQKDYREVIKTLYDALLVAQDAEAESKTKEVAAVSQFTAVESVAKQQVTQFRDDATKAGTELATANNSFKGTVAELDKSKKTLADQLEAKRIQMDEKVSAAEKERDNLGLQVQRLASLVKSLQERLNQKTGSGKISETPDGEITWVNQRAEVVWIDLGSEDRLERQTVFSVFPVDTNASPDLSREKGSIEVTRILDGHMAEARIVSDTVANPILPGDKILSPVWDRGRSEGFALAGFMDIDGDGRSDRNKIRQLIKQNGGRIDAEVDDKGKLTGKIQLNTRYIILGDPPTEKSTAPDLLENFSLLTGQAQELTVEKISVQKFIQQMGFRPEERTVPLGRNARSEDFSAKPINGVQQRSTGNTSSKFKPRVAPKKTTF